MVVLVLYAKHEILLLEMLSSEILLYMKEKSINTGLVILLSVESTSIVE